jgi:hypothetical protein
MIFADNADIINLVIDTLVTTQPSTADLNPQRIEIKKSTNSLKFFIEGQTDPVVKIDVVDDVISGDTTAGLTVNDPVTPGKVSEVTLNGIFSNTSEHLFFPPSSGINTNGSVIGLLQKRTTDIFPTGISAGVVGIDQTSDTDGNSQSFGGYFNSVFTGGLFINSRTISADYSATLFDTHLVCSADLTILLPAFDGDTYIGKMYFVFCGSHTVNIDGNGASLSQDNGFVDTYTQGDGGHTIILIWTGVFWAMNTF